MAAWAIVAVLVLLLFPLCPGPDECYWRTAGASMHVVLFAGLAWMVGRSMPDRWRGWVLWGAMVFLSAGAEWLQPHVGRSAELADWLYGAGGAACICATWHSRRTPIRWVGVLALCLVPLVLEMAWFRMEVRAFPVLADSNFQWSRRGWTLNFVHVDAVATQGLRVEVVSKQDQATFGSYPGLFRAPAGSDWRAARSLRAELFWPAPDPVYFAIRVDDRPGNPVYADRFQREFSVTQGWNQIQIPGEELRKTSGGRRLELEAIKQWGVFLVSDRPLDYFLLGKVQLELQPESQ